MAAPVLVAKSTQANPLSRNCPPPQGVASPKVTSLPGSACTQCLVSVRCDGELLCRITQTQKSSSAPPPASPVSQVWLQSSLRETSCKKSWPQSRFSGEPELEHSTKTIRNSMMWFRVRVFCPHIYFFLRKWHSPWVKIVEEIWGISCKTGKDIKGHENYFNKGKYFITSFLKKHKSTNISL